MKLDRIADLRVYVQVIDSGSLAGAGRILGASSTRVSRCLRHLEEALGVVLVQRTTRRLHVTDEGRVFYRRALRILAELDAAHAELRPDPGVAHGRVRVVLGTITVAYGVMESLGQLLDAHPGLSIQASFTDQPVDLVGGGWDIAFHVGAPPDSTHICTRMGVARTCLAATSEYLARHGIPQVPEDLAHHECLRFISDRPQDTWRLLDPDGVEYEVPVYGRLEIDNSNALWAAMCNGLGIGLCSRSQLGTLVEQGDLVPVLPDWSMAQMPLFALVPAGRQRIPRVRAVLEWMASYMKALA